MTGVLMQPSPASILGEANHRFCNSLQLIVSATNGIIRHGGCDGEAGERLRALQERVASLADISRRLCGPYDPSCLSEAALGSLCTRLAIAFDRPDASFRIEVAGQVAEEDACRALLLLVGELVTNAMKHGLRVRPLQVAIDLVASPGDCRLTVRSNTAGFGGAPRRPRIADDLATSAGGFLHVEVESGEHRVVATLPRSKSVGGSMEPSLTHQSRERRHSTSSNA